MLKPKVIVAGALALLLLVLVIQNTEVVTLQFLFWQFEMSRVILILLTGAIGVICGYVLAKLIEPRRSDPAPPAEN